MSSSGPTQLTGREQKWSARPTLAWSIRALVTIFPLAAAIGIGVGASYFLPPEKLGLDRVPWWIGLTILSTALLWFFDKFARRLLPLALLFKLSLIFPDQAPSRYSVAMKASTTRQLQRRIDEISAGGAALNDDESYAEQMLTLIAMLSEHDKLTRGHCERVRGYTELIIQEMGLPESDAEKLRWAALLHDLGKLMVPFEILNSPDRPTPEQWEVLKSHTWHGMRLAKPIQPWLGEWGVVIGDHHERWDGDGYPRGLAGNHIHLGARIVAVADTFDVITSARSYKKPMTAAEGRAEIARCAGGQFDPAVVRSFLNVSLGRLRLAAGPLAWLSSLPGLNSLPAGTLAGAPAAVSTLGAALAGVAIVGAADIANDPPAVEVAFTDEIDAPLTLVLQQSVTEDETTTIVLDPPDLGPLTVTVPGQPGRGTLTLNGMTVRNGTAINIDGQDGIVLVYRPDRDYDGADQLTVVMCTPSGACFERTIRVKVGGVNDPPTAGDLAMTLAENGVVSGGLPGGAFQVVLPVSDVDGDTLRITNVSGATQGELAVVGGRAFSYTHGGSEQATDQATYTVADPSGATATGRIRFTITPVNDAPTAVDDAASMTEDTTADIDAIANDTDVDSAPLRLDSVSAPRGQAKITNSRIRYTPPTDFFGNTALEYRVCDADGACDTGRVLVKVVNAPDPPTAVDDWTSIPENRVLLIQPAINDTDPDGDLSPATLSIIAPPRNGSISVQSGGVVRWQPSPGFAGNVSFTYRICDTTARCDDAVVSVTVLNANDPPVAVNDTYLTAEDTDLLAPVLANDSDPDGDALTLVIISPPNLGYASINGFGVVSYSPRANVSGTDTFTYRITDPSGQSATATATVVIIPVNDAPVANDDVATTDEDTAVDVFVLANDTDIEDGAPVPASATVTNPPVGGTAVASPSGSIRYTPPLDYSGMMTFGYSACDSDGACDTATVTLTIAPSNDTPSVLADSDLVVEDGTSTLAVTANDTDPEDGVVVNTSVRIDEAPNDGSAISNLDGTITYTPDPDFNGSDFYRYEACDSDGLCSTAVVTYTVTPVNDAPIAVADFITVEEGGFAETPVLKGNDIDVDGDVLSVPSTGQGANGVVADNGDPNDGKFIYTHDGSATMSDSFTYVLEDPTGAVDVGTVYVTITPVNDAPIVLDDLFTTDEDMPLTQDVTINDTDIEDGTVVGSSVAITSPPLAGAAISNGDGTITYTPAANVFGADAFMYQACDIDGLCDTATVNVTVNAINDAPVALDDSDTVGEDGSVDIDVAGNDTDIEDGTPDPSTVRVTIAPGRGSTLVLPGGTIRYTPNPNANGADSFTYEICDLDALCDTARVTLTINAVNDPPIAVGNALNLNRGQTDETGDLRLNDLDVDGDPLTIVSFTQGSSGTVTDLPTLGDGRLEYTHDGSTTTADSFTYTVQDPSGASSTATVTVSITNTNTAPDVVDDLVITDEAVAIVIDVAANDSDPEDGIIDRTTVGAITLPAGGTLVNNGDGTFTYSPNIGFKGIDGFEYAACDSEGSCDEAIVSITVNAVQYAPEANDDAATTNEDTPVIIAVLANDSDRNGEALTIISVGAPSKGTAIDNGDGTITYTPSPDTNGADSFTYTINDTPGWADTATVTLTVIPVADAPVALADAFTVLQDKIFTAVAPGLLVNDSDADGNSLTIATIPASPPSNGSVTLRANGSFDYDPDPGYVGPDSFTYRVLDGTGRQAIGTVSITVESNVRTLYFGVGTGEFFPLQTTPPPDVVPVPDHDGDDDSDPGLSFEPTNWFVQNSSYREGQTWVLTATSPIVMDGDFRISIWAANRFFAANRIQHPKVEVYECTGSTWGSCTLLLFGGLHISDWARSGFYDQRAFTVGTIDETIEVGNTLRVAFSTDHNEMWMPLTQSLPTWITYTAG